jgi:hypothetical protein
MEYRERKRREGKGQTKKMSMEKDMPENVNKEIARTLEEIGK